jgi:hypothetical protein
MHSGSTLVKGDFLRFGSPFKKGGLSALWLPLEQEDRARSICAARAG